MLETKDKNILDNLVKVALKHERMIEAIAKASGDISKLMSRILARCSNPECDRPATRKHKLHHGNIWCDRCSAEVIVKSRTCLSNDYFMQSIGKTTQGHYEESANEELWEDVMDADSIRNVIEYVDIIRSLQNTH